MIENEPYSFSQPLDEHISEPDMAFETKLNLSIQQAKEGKVKTEEELKNFRIVYDL